MVCGPPGRKVRPLTPGEANALASLVGSHGKAIELAELEDRLAALEAQMLADSMRPVMPKLPNINHKGANTMMSAEQIITLALNPETRSKMEMDIFGRLARIREQQAQLDADLEDILVVQRLVQIVKGYEVQASTN